VKSITRRVTRKLEFSFTEMSVLGAIGPGLSEAFSGSWPWPADVISARARLALHLHSPFWGTDGCWIGGWLTRCGWTVLRFGLGSGTLYDTQPFRFRFSLPGFMLSLRGGFIFPFLFPLSNCSHIRSPPPPYRPGSTELRLN